LDALCDLAGNLSLVAELIDTYLADQRRVGAVLRQALAAQDPDRLFRAAHSLKSSSASLGATPLSRLYAEAERLGRAGTLAGAEAAVERIEGEAQRVEVALRAWLAARPADSQAG
jgi:HPt (histidine-containing phosphotransfer) domain-containing protein